MTPPVPPTGAAKAVPAAMPAAAPAEVPAAFASGMRFLRRAMAQAAHASRGGLRLVEVAAPRRMAPYALAVAAEVVTGGMVVATGRLVALHDPQGQDGWRGDTRVVVLVQADTDPEMAGDAALGAVGWSWLTDALARRGATHTAAGGTVTRTVSSRFGELEEPEQDSEVEVRASWTPTPTSGELDLGAHLWAWCDLLYATAGMPPAGVSGLTG